MITQQYNNFVRGQLDHDLNGRFDLGIYSNGFEYSRNFYVNYKGNLKNFSGKEYIAETGECFLKEFRFNKDQTYLMLFKDNSIDFYSYDPQGNFGYVTTLQTELSLENARISKFAQNADVMYITNENMTPKIITRTASNVFTWGTPTTTGLNFTDMGNPRCCTFYSSRLWFGGFTKKPTTIVASESGVYEQFTLKTTDILVTSPLSLTLSDITDPITWMYGGKNNLNVGNAEGVSLVSGGGGSVITATSVSATLANKERASDVAPIQKDSEMFYSSLDSRKLYYFKYDLLTEAFNSKDATLVSKDATVGEIKRLCYKRDDNDLIFCLMKNGTVSAVVYQSDENINGWFPMETKGFILDIETITRPDGKDDLFFLVNRNGVFYLERMTDEVEFTRFLDTDFKNDTNKKEYNRLIAEELKRCNYLDNSSIYNQLKTSTITFVPDETDETKGVLTSSENDFNETSVGHFIVYKTKTGKEYGYYEIKSYISNNSVSVEIVSEGVSSNTYADGWYLSFNSLSGLSSFEGKTISIVADGGYLGEFVVKDGAISLGRECTSVCIGYSYDVLANTFPIGNGQQQTESKNLQKFIMRFVNTAGSEIGTDVSDMQEIQMFNPSGFFDLPPLLMNGDIEVVARDSTEREKRIYIEQKYPLPFNLTMLQLDIDYRRMP